MSSTGTLNIPIELIKRLNRRDCVLFVGDALDGVASQGARLAALLVDECGAHCKFCRESGQCQHPNDCQVPLSRAAQLYEGRMGRHGLLTRAGDFVAAHYPSRPVPSIYRALAALPVRVIVTTALDDRLEAALEEAGRRTNVVVRDIDVPFSDPAYVQLIRLHGTCRDRERLVLTEDDAADLFGRLSPVVCTILRGLLAEKTLLFMGYRLDDPYFLALYRQTTEPIARLGRRAYAVQPAPDSLLVDRWRGQIDLITAEPLPFLTQLQHSIRLQAVKEKRAALPPEPYKFLDYYEEKDSCIFFGRDLEADLLVSTILAHKLTVFYGRSGTGKTSLLLARVLPALQAEDYQVAYARMLRDPATEIKAAVQGVPAGELAYADLGRRLATLLVEVLPPAGRLVVVLDQFEEFFIRQGQVVRRAFAQELADCLAQKDLDLRFVLSQRDDYLGALDQLAEFLPEDVFAHRFRLENLTREKALLAILKPAEAFGLTVEEGLRQQLIADLEDQGLEPASLQIVLYRLYRDAVEQGLWLEADKQGIGLTLERYTALGGTREILAGYLDEVLAKLPSAAEQQAARAVLKSMVTAEHTKAVVTRREINRSDLLTRVELDEKQLMAILYYLRQKRVVRMFGEEAAEGGRYELAHDVMVEKVWAWISDEELRVLNVRDMLRRAVGDWQTFGHLVGRDKLELAQSCCDALALDGAELELLFRSALASGVEVRYWSDRAPTMIGKVEGELFEGLESGEPDRAQKAVSQLAALASPFVVCRLADWVEGGYTTAPTFWVDHRGERHEVHCTALNLATPRQRWAALALARMDLPEATAALARWTPPGMVLVPAGPFTMGGTEDSDEGPVHELWLDAFWIDRYPVTNAQWAAFLVGGGWERRELWTEAGWQWRLGVQPQPGDEHKRDHPMVEVCWYESLAYARWAGKGLVSEAQWEKAARGADARRYPWGDEFDKDRCNTSESGTGGVTRVGKYSPQGDSPYGCADMAGNVWERCSNLYVPYPYKAEDGREILEGTGTRMLRGGSWSDDQDSARSTYRDHDYPDDRNYVDVGFRVGLSLTSFLQVVGPLKH